jgi:hypothetical protein
LERILGNLLSIGLRRETGQAGVELRVDAGEGEILLAVSVSACSDAPGRPHAVPSENELGLGFLVARIMVEGHGGKLVSRQGPAGELVLRFSLPTGS